MFAHIKPTALLSNTVKSNIKSSSLQSSRRINRLANYPSFLRFYSQSFPSYQQQQEPFLIKPPVLNDDELAELKKPIGALPRNFVVTTPNVPGYEVQQTIGLVAGNTVRVRHAVQDWLTGVRAIFGGELTSYTLLMVDAREEATKRMVDEAVALGANAIINIRYTTSNLAANASEIYVYGTAVVVK
jgi:uncharacterized protein YbjQ (UPF0145 family)